ncbi:MAG: substrate-binding domain-containing protein [Sphingomonadaceae bacterium]
MRKAAVIVAIMGLALLTAACNDARTQIRIVGSSTVFPFTTAVAENFSRTYRRYSAPIVESTGTGGGIKLLCAGVGARHPDIANASRRMKVSELEACAANGVTEVVEIRVGIDGVVLAQGKDAVPLDLSLRDVYSALAARPFGQEQTARTWKDVNPELPDLRIEVIGQPSTSGTRDAFNELYMEAGCASDPAMKALKESDEEKYALTCMRIREDGAFVEAGENDNLIVQKLASNPRAVGVLGFSFLEANLDKLRDVSINGVPANYETISAGEYPASRLLYLYVKKQHVPVIRGMEEFIAEYVNERAFGPDGYLRRRGLIPLPDAERELERQRALNLIPVTAEELGG